MASNKHADAEAVVGGESEARNMSTFNVTAHMKPVLDVQFNREGDIVFTTSQATNDDAPTVCAWSTGSGALVGMYDVTKAVVGCAVNSETTLLATAGKDYVCNVFHAPTGKRLAKFECEAPLRCVEFSPDDRKLLVVTDKVGPNESAVHIYSLPESLAGGSECAQPLACATTLPPNDTPITSALWGPSGNTVYFSDESGTAVIYDVEHRREVGSAFPHNKRINRMHFSADYSSLVTASSDNTACLLDPRDCKAFQRYKSAYAVYDASISPISDHVLMGGGVAAENVTQSAGSSQFSAEFYHAFHEDCLGTVKLHFGTILNVRYHPSGKLFASGGQDGHLRICKLPGYVSTDAPGAKPAFVHERLGEGGEDGDDDGEDEAEEEYYEEGGEDEYFDDGYDDEVLAEAGAAVVAETLDDI